MKKSEALLRLVEYSLDEMWQNIVARQVAPGRKEEPRLLSTCSSLKYSFKRLRKGEEIRERREERDTVEEKVSTLLNTAAKKNIW